MRLTIKAKLAAAFALLTILTGAMATLAIFDLNSLNTDITEMVEGPVAELAARATSRSAVLKSVQAEKSTVMRSDPTQISGYVTEIDHERQVITTLQNKLEASSNAVIKAKAAEFKAAYLQWVPVPGPDPQPGPAEYD